MRLNSDFHDYYDGVARADRDGAHTWDRTTRSECLTIPGKHPFLWMTTFDEKIADYCRGNCFDLMVLGLAGEVRPMLRVRQYKVMAADYGRVRKSCARAPRYAMGDKWSFLPDGDFLGFPHTGYCHDLEEIEHAVDANRKSDNPYTRKPHDEDILGGLRSMTWFKELFLKLRTPLFAVSFSPVDVRRFTREEPRFSRDNAVLVVNPSLESVGFQKTMAVTDVWQRLATFVGNDLATSGDPDMPVGGDKVVAESKGFDKFSFRKQKQPV